MFKKFLLPTLMLCLLSFGLFAQKMFPTPELITVDRQPAALANYVGQGKPTVVAMWATWCQPCHIELDHMKKYLDKWQGEYGVNVLAVSIDQRYMVNRIKPLVSRKGWKYNILVDTDGQLQAKLGFESIPTMYILDGAGKIVRTFTRYKSGQEHKVDEILQRLIAK